MAKTKNARLSLTMPGPSETESETSPPGSDEPSSPGFVGEKQTTKDQGKSKRKITKKQSSHTVQTTDLGLASNAKGSVPLDQPQSPASPTSPNLTSLPPFPPSPKTSKHSRDQSRSFFGNIKASKSSAKIQPVDATIRKVPNESDTTEDTAKWSSRTKSPAKTKSTPDLRSVSSADQVPDFPGLDTSQSSLTSATSSSTRKIQRRPVGGQGKAINVPRSQTYASGAVGPTSPVSEIPESKKNGLFHNFMKRNHHGRGDESSVMKPPTPTRSKASELPSAKPPSRDRSTSRNPSPHIEGDSNHLADKNNLRVQLKDQRSQSFRENSGVTLFSGLKNTTARAAEGIGKAHTRFFRGNKQTIHAANQTVLDYSQPYELKVINLPLVEQTRITRIARRLEDSKDKTEFWMPALPWRCIDFLNFTGCETEGLYRVPGSDREVRMWKQRFDQEHDVNLFDEEDLYDVNTVGSLFKAWLRELPEDVFPQSIQEDLSSRHSSEEKAPQELRDILSNLPPWNYYLLFAITCHLSLLHAYSDKNKMSFHNLFVCFAPALKMNGDCFRWLVADWRNCWKGCLTEKAALEEEYRIIEGGMLDAGHSSPSVDEKGRSASPADSADFHQPLPERPATHPTQQQLQQRQQQKPKNVSGDNTRPKIVQTNNSSPRGLRRAAVSPERSNDQGNAAETPSTPSHGRSPSQLPELSFPQPISPFFSFQQG